MWNDTDTPLAVFFTVRCYGTWLHGDERGSVDRDHRAFGTPRLTPNKPWNDHKAKMMKNEPVTLDAERRRSVERAIRDTSSKRGWNLLAQNVRTNHFHCVIDIGEGSSKRALGALKANATRQMREDGVWRQEHSPWAEKGSRRKLWNERSVANACDYVINGQGDDLPDFDRW